MFSSSYARCTIGNGVIVCFTIEEIGKLFEGAGFEVIELQYVQRETVNHKENIHAQRIFVQGRFQKRTPDSDSCTESLQSSSQGRSKDSN